MELLFKREQSQARLVKVQFKLWSKVSLDDEEKALINRYRMHDAILVAVDQPFLIRQIAIVGLACSFVTFIILTLFFGTEAAIILAIIAGVGAGYWWFNEKRDTIFVKDLIHGRYFSCNSVVELARKEAWLETVVSYFRQVIESAKHWDGTEQYKIEPLPKDQAREVILRGL